MPTALTEEQDWTIRITPHRGWLDWRLHQLWRYRDLISLFVRRDFVSFYKQTILGPAWHIVQPLLTTVMFTLIFSQVARLSTDGAPPFLFYMTGLIAWTYFANNLTKISASFAANAHLLGKVYFHRLVVPISITLSNLIAFGIQLAIFLLVLVFCLLTSANLHLTSWVFWTPLFILMLAGYGLAVGLIVAALTTRYRDLANLVTFGTQLFMYATPVIYPASAVPERHRWILQANPLVPVFEGLRMGFLGSGTIVPAHLAISVAIMLVLLVIGLMLFTHVERTFMDTV